MKKIFLIMLVCFSIIFTANADEGRTCRVYNSKYTATISHGSTMVSGDSPYVSIVVESPEEALGYGNTVTVWVNALDRSSGCIEETIEVVILVKGGQTKGSRSASFKKLEKGKYYNVSIDRASCD